MKLFLNGGGSGKQTVLTYKEINKIIDHNKPVLYIPLAMDEEEHPYDSCYEWIKEEISSIDIPNIEMVKSFEELEKKDFDKYSLIYIGGGNTYKLLKGIKETKIYDKLKKYILNDGIVYGSSAGSVIFGKDINIIEVMDKNGVNLSDTKGFNYLNNICIFVHYTNYRSKLSEEENKTLTEKYTGFITKYTKNNEKVIAIPEEDTIFFDGNNIKVLGELPYYIFENGKKEKIDEGNFLIVAGVHENLLHALLVCGYDETGFYLYDPLHFEKLHRSYKTIKSFMNTGIGKWFLSVKSKCY